LTHRDGWGLLKISTLKKEGGGIGLRKIIGLVAEFVYMTSLFLFTYLFTGAIIVKIFL
jgi:hypothetical protein